MKTIWKYELGVTDEQIISIPENFMVLSLQIQQGTPCIWVLVDTESPRKKDVRLKTYGTGHPMNTQERTYIGTYQTGIFVFHVFLEREV